MYTTTVCYAGVTVEMLCRRVVSVFPEPILENSHVFSKHLDTQECELSPTHDARLPLLAYSGEKNVSLARVTLSTSLLHGPCAPFPT